MKKPSLKKTSDDQFLRYYLDRDLNVKPFMYGKSHSNDAFKGIIGNIFKTPNDALSFVEHQKVIREFRFNCVNLSSINYNKLKEYMPLWFLSYSYKYKKIIIERFTGDLYSEYLFKSAEKAMETVKKAGYDNVVKYYFLYNARISIEDKPIRKTYDDFESSLIITEPSSKNIYNFTQDEAIKIAQCAENNNINELINLMQKKLYGLTYKKNNSDTYVIDESDYLSIMKEIKQILKLDLLNIKNQSVCEQDNMFIVNK